MGVSPPYRRWRTGIGATTLTLLVVVSTVVLGLGGAVAAPADGQRSLAQAEGDGDASTLGPADEAYVYENGTAVLVYESDASDLSKGEFGLDVSEGLFHALAVTRTDGQVNGTASATAILEQNRLLANGSMAIQRPSALESLTLDVSGEATDEASSVDATLEATVAAREAPTTQLFESASTSGSVVTTANAFQTSGTASVQMATRMGQRADYEFSLTESESGYTLDAAQNQVVTGEASRRWSTRARAEQTLRGLYGVVGQQLGGEASVTLESYSFAEVTSGDGYRLDVEYTVQYAGIDDGLSRRIATMLAESDQYDLSQEEARAVGERVAAVQIDHVDVSLSQRPSSAEASWSARIEDYDGAVLAFLDVAQSMDTETATDSFAESLDRARKQFEAQQAANLTQRTTWSASLDRPDQATASVSAELHVSTENWAAYREQLRQRGIDPASTTFSLHAETDGDQVTASGEFEVRKQDLLDEAVDSMLNASSGESAGGTQARELLRAFRRADLQRARADVSLDGREVTFEAGAKFNNLTAFRDAVSASGELPPVAAIAGRTEDETTRTYVYVRNAVPEDASESDVRAKAYVDAETEVHMPGTFNASLPRPDNEAAREYLGLPEDGGSGGSSSGPGFGLVGAVAALAAVGALLARRE